MTLTFWQRLDRAGRNLAPFAVTVLLVLVGMVPVPLPLYAPVAPLLGVMAVYYWAIHRPDLLPPSAVFGVGLLQDLLSGAPLGMNALVLVTVQWVVLNQRRYFLASTFALMWFGFSLIVLGAAFLQWGAHSAFNATLLRVDTALAQAMLTLAMFPMFAWLFVRVHRAFLQG